MDRGPAFCHVCAPDGQTDAEFLLEAWRALGLLTSRSVWIAVHFPSVVRVETVRGAGFGSSWGKRPDVGR